MLFNSAEFLLFFPAVVAVYFALPSNFRWSLLLAASYYFYMCWKAEYVFLLAGSTLVDYFAGMRMAAIPGKAGRRKYLLLSLIVNLSILFGFKYYNFVNDSLRHVCEQFNVFYDVPAFQVLLPVGISFYTFQSLSYTIDVYRGDVEPERHLGRFALYVSFFPQLVAGPIERSSNFLPQLRRTYAFDYDRVTSGLRQMLWGFFKKVVIADRLAVYVNEVYNHPGEYHGAPIAVATFFFAFQIYCDFSGYSDIAIGAARVLGFRLMENFDRPYQATSVADFWRRWHISLSTWFRDYVYVPLGGSRVAAGRRNWNLLVTFLISGLWHGANWTFVVWGALHAFYMIAGKLLQPYLPKASWRERAPRLATCLRVLFTFSLVCFAWLFFRANSLSDATVLLSNSLVFADGGLDFYIISSRELNLCYLGLLVLAIVELSQGSQKAWEWALGGSWIRRWSVYYALTGAILYLGHNEAQEFIYFQF